MGILSRLNVNADLCNKMEIIDMFEEHKNGRKTEICELGPLNHPLSLEYDGGEDCEFYGIEYPGYADETRRAFANKGRKIIMQECDLNKDKWPFDDNKFDVIISNQVLEHMYNTDCFFEELYRVMKPGGYGIVSVPNLSSLHNIFQLLLTFQPIMCNASEKFFGVGNPLSSYRHKKRTAQFHSHLRLMTFRALKELFELNGFKIAEKRGGTFMAIPGIGRYIARVIPWYSYYCTVKVRKP